MQIKRMTGPQAGSLKYDILTALNVYGLHGSPGRQVSCARLSALITARYNWRLDELCVGQRDMARMWHVTERTVKREVKRWIETRMLICTRPGVRGRVGAYRLNLPEIFRLTEPLWPSVGPDFAERMATLAPGAPPAEGAKILRVDFSATGPEPEAAPAPRGTWRAATARMRQLHPDKFGHWIAPLACEGQTNGTLTLRAPSRFAAHYIETHLMPILHEAVEAEIGPGLRIVLLS